ncbi:hypothetical protein C4J94_2464 [Pseudomonas sp. R5-89-07]|nr:hypothetical protein C4J94_2464 [Pseudomonas sp. R5-89-07]
MSVNTLVTDPPQSGASPLPQLIFIVCEIFIRHIGFQLLP